MISFKVKGLQRCAYAAIKIIFLLSIASCNVKLYGPLEEFVNAIAAGKTIRVSVDDTIMGHDSDPVDFSYQKLGEVSEVKTVLLSNIGIIDMTVNTIILDMEGLGGIPYVLDTSSIELPLLLSPGDSISFDVQFQPSIVENHEAVLTSNIIIGSSDKEISAFKLNLSGIGETPEIYITSDGVTYTSGDDLRFAVDDTGGTVSKVLTIHNSSNVALDVSGISGTSAPFTIPGSNISVDALSSTTVTATFSPTAEGGFSSTITISSDDLDESSYILTLRGATTGSDPKLYGDLALWLDASKIVSTDTDEVNGTGYVVKWKDSSDLSHDALPFPSGGEVVENTGTDHERRIPQYVSSSINGKAAVRFDDADGITEDNNTANSAYYNGDILYISGQIIDYVQGMSVFVVLKPTDFFQDRMFLFGSNSPYLRIYDAYFWNDFMSMTNTTSGWSNPELDTSYLITNIVDNSDIVDNADRYRVWVNGTSGASNSIFYEALGIRLYNLDIGNYSSNFNRYGFDGDIAEIIIYGKSLSDTEVTEVHNYLNTKYALW